MAKKYYWLRLKENWFESKAIKKLRKIAGGDTYTIIYLKMQLLSLKNEGKLYYEGVEDTFTEELALELDEDPDNVNATVSFLQRIGLIEIVDSDEYMLQEVPKAIGSESESAERVRKYRDNKNKKELEQKTLHCNAQVTDCNGAVTACNTEIEIEIEKEIDIYNNSAEPKASAPEPEPIITLPLNTGEEYPFFQSDIDEFAELYPAVDVLQAMRGMKGWCLTNPAKRKTKRGIRRFVNSWLAKEQDKGGKRPQYTNASAGKKNAFNNFTQRENDYAAIQNELVKKSFDENVKGEMADRRF